MSVSTAETLDDVQNELAMAGHAMLAWNREELNVWRAGCSRCLGRATVWSEWGQDRNLVRPHSGPVLKAVHAFRTPILLGGCDTLPAVIPDRSPTP